MHQGTLPPWSLYKSKPFLMLRWQRSVLLHFRVHNFSIAQRSPASSGGLCLSDPLLGLCPAPYWEHKSPYPLTTPLPNSWIRSCVSRKSYLLTGRVSAETLYNEARSWTKVVKSSMKTDGSSKYVNSTHCSDIWTLESTVLVLRVC